MKFIDLFAGIGGIRLGFEEFFDECVFSSEIDKYAQQTYEANLKKHLAEILLKLMNKIFLILIFY